MAPAGPGRSRWPSSMAVTEDRGRWSPAPPEAFLLAAPVGPGRRPRSEGVPAWSAQGQTVATREPRFRTLREPRRAPGPCQLQGCGCSPAKGETVNDDNHHELAPRRRAHLRSRRPSPRHGAAERTKHSRPPRPLPRPGRTPSPHRPRTALGTVEPGHPRVPHLTPRTPSPSGGPGFTVRTALGTSRRKQRRSWGGQGARQAAPGPRTAPWRETGFPQRENGVAGAGPGQMPSRRRRPEPGPPPEPRAVCPPPARRPRPHGAATEGRPSADGPGGGWAETLWGLRLGGCLGAGVAPLTRDGGPEESSQGAFPGRPDAPPGFAAAQPTHEGTGTARAVSPRVL